MLKEIGVHINEIRAVLLRIIPTPGQQRSEEVAFGYQCLVSDDEVVLTHLKSYLAVHSRSGQV